MLASNPTPLAKRSQYLISQDWKGWHIGNWRNHLLRILLICYLYGITSERKLVEELRMHLAWRWFTGLSFDQEIPHHSTFSKNRHGQFHEPNLFQRNAKVAESAICQSTG